MSKRCPSPRAAGARPGPAAPPFPAVAVPLPPSASLPPAALALGPLAVRRRQGPGAPPAREGARRGAGRPGDGTVLCLRAMGAPPAGAPLLAQTTRRPRGGVACRENRPLGLQ